MSNTLGGATIGQRWDVLPGNPELAETFVRQLHVSSLVARVLVADGITTVEEAARFLDPDLTRDWLDPLIIPGMSAAADRVQLALERGERICVFGDFDVDGITATCLLAEGLSALGGQVATLIPRRFGEGYGLSVEACNRAKEESDPALVITVDNGIAAKHEVEWMLEHGIDVVITDHHEPSDLVPQGVPVCDPKLETENPCRELAGVGVAGKLVAELGRRFGKPDLWRGFTDLIALGTVSDMMLLQGENRSLVADGLRALRASVRPGLVALAATSGIDLAQVTSDSLPFSIIPRLNASGRMGCADLALDLLMCHDPGQAAVLAGELEQVNQTRRDIEAGLSDAAMAQAAELFHEGGRSLVLAGAGWHEGVKGIVASRIVNRYHVPTIMFSISETDGLARGSGRSVGQVDLFHAVEQCSDLVERFGGHAGAVGVTINPANLPAFRERLEEVMQALPPEEFIDRGEVTSIVGLEELNVPTIRSLDVLQPFGQGNKVPLFGLRAVSMRSRSRVGAGGDHLRFIATDGIRSIPAIMFRAPQPDKLLGYDGAVDLVFEAVAEEWQGKVKPKLMVRDIVVRAADGEAEADAALLAGTQPSSEEPTRASRRAELAALSPDDLEAELVRSMIGESPLLEAQRCALSALARDRSTLCVMATGRGKSLIFHVHAARLAISQNKASVFVFPLRALVNDQVHHLTDALAPLGVNVRTLTGETPQEQREEVFSGLASGMVDVVLTTPEFLSIHVARFAEAGRVKFLVVDESHHAGAAKSGNRAAYLDLPAVREQLGRPTTLAVTATANTEVARDICELVGVRDDRDVIVDATRRPNLHVSDERMSFDRDAALVNLVASGEKCIVYVNSRATSVQLTRLLRRNLSDLAPRIAFYHAGLPRPTRLAVEQAFRSGQLTCVVSTSAFGEGVNLPDVRHVVLYHLPFGRVSFNQMSGRAGRDGDDAWIHLLYNAQDKQLDERILSSAAPARDSLAALWRALTATSRELGGGQAFAFAPADLLARARAIDASIDVDDAFVESGVGIFGELGLLSVQGYAEQRHISVASNPPKVDLASSVRYQEGMRALGEFEEFCAWALSAGADELLEALNHPIVPDFGRRMAVEGEDHGRD